MSDVWFVQRDLVVKAKPPGVRVHHYGSTPLCISYFNKLGGAVLVVARISGKILAQAQFLEVDAYVLQLNRVLASCFCAVTDFVWIRSAHIQKVQDEENLGARSYSRMCCVDGKFPDAHLLSLAAHVHVQIRALWRIRHVLADLVYLENKPSQQEHNEYVEELWFEREHVQPGKVNAREGIFFCYMRIMCWLSRANSFKVPAKRLWYIRPFGISDEVIKSTSVTWGRASILKRRSKGLLCFQRHFFHWAHWTD